MHRPDDDDQQPPAVPGWIIGTFWVLLLLSLALLFNNWLEKARNPNQDVSSYQESGNVRVVTLKRNRYGHYHVTGTINGHTVEFLLDTGATNISVPAVVADRIGLQRMHEISFYTANGLARGYATRISEAGIGDIVLTDLQASINPNVDDEVILLGMTFLKRIEFTQRGDTLILRQYH
ncbi:MAG: TIGR02281 family clan AA aspartic protease [Gammaproteobacteria bacterium]|nr:TIGR02281 family clan AA aspartic protease [Gammaproteobacteria bacterium]